MSLSPKQRLQQSPNAKRFAEMLASPQFEEASEVAMLTFVNGLPSAFGGSDQFDSAKSIAYHQQLIGARRYLGVLSNLLMPDVPDRPVSNPGVLKPVP